MQITMVRGGGRNGQLGKKIGVGGNKRKRGKKKRRKISLKKGKRGL